MERLIIYWGNKQAQIGIHWVSIACHSLDNAEKILERYPRLFIMGKATHIRNFPDNSIVKYPEAHTCFGELTVAQYRTKRRNLRKQINKGE